MSCFRTLLLAPLLLLAACQPAKPSAGAGSMDMFAPVHMRLQPVFTHIVAATAAAPMTLQADLEFTDQFKDVAKSPGSVNFTLYAAAALGRGDKLGSWAFDLNTPDANHQHWSAITRTYQFTLPIAVAAGGKLPDHVILSADVTLPGTGTKLSDALTLATH